MWAFQTTVSLISLFCLNSALPVVEDTVDTVAIRGVPDGNNIDSDNNTIDLSRLGPKAFGYPSIESGQAVATWNESSLMNPEEMGKYAEGDILMPSLGRNGLRAESLRWSDGVIPYVIEGDFTTGFDHGGGIRLPPLDLPAVCSDNGQMDYVAIKNGNTGCWSSVGRVGGRQVVNLQSPGCVKKLGSVLHELLHTIGFMHEQSRPERDEYVTINYNNVKPGTEISFKKAEKANTNDFGISYDYNSVMHYSEYAFSKNQQKTIEPKVSGFQLGQREELSPGDVKKVNNMYNCNKDGTIGEYGRVGRHPGKLI